MLSEAHWESVDRISWHCARYARGSTPLLTLDDRHEAALYGIVSYLVDRGWPDVDRPLFAAASNAITHEQRDRAKHLSHFSFWQPPRHELDPVAEAVTDRIGVGQLVWALTAYEWEGVWALAEVMRRDGSIREAAALIDVSEASLVDRLLKARKRARRLWISPGETPPMMYRPARGGEKTRWQTWKLRQAQLDRRRQANMDRGNAA